MHAFFKKSINENKRQNRVAISNFVNGLYLNLINSRQELLQNNWISMFYPILSANDLIK